jgi:hypothetical protein
MIRQVLVPLSLLCALPAGRPEAQLLHTLVPPNGEVDGSFGVSVSAAADVNNDGSDDVIVGAYLEDPGGGPTDAGRAYVYSGRIGVLIYELASPNEQAGGHFGETVSGVGDADNDGYDDVAVGAHEESTAGSPPGAGRAYVFSGQAGTLLYTLLSPNEKEDGWFGISVSGIGDVNNDGYDDVLVGAKNESPHTSPYRAGRAYVFSGMTGSLLHTLVSPNEEEFGNFGYAVSGAGDVNGDGHPDLVVGAHRENPGASPTDAGRAHVFCGQTATVLHTLASPNEEADGLFGSSVSGAGDVNNDGCDDVVVGARYEDPGASPADAGRVYVYDGQTGDLLHALASPHEQSHGLFGCSVASAGDVDNDGCADVIAGASREDPGSGPPEAGQVYVFSGATGDTLYTLFSPNQEFQGHFGASVAGAEAMGRDGSHEVLVGAPQEDDSFTDCGRAYVFTTAVILSGHVSGGVLGLHWTVCPGVSQYWMYGADNHSYFDPELVAPYEHRLAVISSGTTQWTSSAGIGDPSSNWTYQIVAMSGSGQELCRSNRFGEYDFGSQTPD